MSDEDVAVENSEPSLLAKIKSIHPLRSDKPFLITTRDALIVSVLTVLVSVIIYFFMYLVTGDLESMFSWSFLGIIGKSLAICIALQYGYEYAGLNAMLAESSMRYAKGSALSKYKSRNEAFVAQIAADECMKMLRDVTFQNQENKETAISRIEDNLKRFNAMIKTTRQTPLIVELANSGMRSDEILRNINKRKEYITSEDLELLLNLVPNGDDVENLDRLRAAPRLLEIMGTNEKVVRYFMQNGFDKLKSSNGRFNLATMDLAALLNEIDPKLDVQSEYKKSGLFSRIFRNTATV